MFTDFMILDIADAAEAVHSDEASCPTLSLDGITDLELMELSTIVLQKEYEPELAFQNEEDEVTIVRMDPALADRLATLGPDDVVSAAKKWVKTEGLSDFTLDEVSDSLSQLAAFAAEAKRAKKPLLYVTAI